MLPIILAAVGTAISAYGAIQAGKAQAAALRGNASLQAAAADAEARAVEVNGELDQRQAEQEAAVIERNAAAEVRYIDDQVIQETVATGRERQDLGVERRAALGKTRAALAAAGYSLAEGSALEVIKQQEGDYAAVDTRMGQDLSTTVTSLRNRRDDVAKLAEIQAGYSRESGMFANAFASVRADDIRENSIVGSALAGSQANAIRTSSLLTAAGTAALGASQISTAAGTQQPANPWVDAGNGTYYRA